MGLKKNIQNFAVDICDDVIALRRHLHQYPELSFQEVETGKFIAQQLELLGIKYEHGIADNGVVALIEGVNPKQKITALRADMDALPIQEENNVSYKSKHDGIMHACGHDVHTSSLLGTARILHQFKDHFQGTIKLIFQPAEERLPGGASIMIKEGVLENPAPVSILGQHVHPPLAAGKIGLKPGIYMASADELFMTIKGKGGHGAIPQDCIDPIVITASILTAFQQIVSRRANPAMPTVITWGKINSTGGSTNVIPEAVKLMGTFRTMDEQWRFEAHEIMKTLAHNMAKSMGATCELDILVGYPTLYNDIALAEAVKDYAIDFLGVENVIDLPIRMTAEDFAFYSQKIPACFYRLGVGHANDEKRPALHTSNFNVDETCLKISTGLMAWLAIQTTS